MDLDLPDNLTPFLVPKGTDLNEFTEAPCPMCDSIGSLYPVKDEPMVCAHNDVEKELLVSGISCTECQEIFLDETSLELYLNTLLKLRGIQNRKVLIESGKVLEQTVH